MTGQLSGDERARISRGPVAGLCHRPGPGPARRGRRAGTRRCWWPPGWTSPACGPAPPAGEDIPPLWRGLAGTVARPLAAARRPAAGACAGQLAGLSAAERRPAADRPGPLARRRRARPRLGRGGRSRAGVQGPGLRLADRGRAAQPAGRRDRAAAAGHAGLRLPDPGRGGRLVRGGTAGRSRDQWSAAAVPAVRAAGGRADRDRGDGVPVPGRGARPAGPVGPGRVGHRRDRRVPGRPGLG